MAPSDTSLAELARVRASYDTAAAAYAEHLAGELAAKPLDRHLLARFAEAVRGQGLVADLGCGPGHVGGVLATFGVDVVGIDLSPRMVCEAARLHPDIEFRLGDLLALDLSDASLAGAVLFYAIVHLDPAGVAAAMVELRRVVEPGGAVLVAFHIGNETNHVDELWGAPVDLDFRFHPTGDVARALTAAGFTVTETVERAPYEGAEHPSHRAYLFARAT